MPMTINTNVASLNAQRFLGQSQGMLGTSLSRLSSGLRINSAADDAAGLAISGRMSAQIRGLNQAVRNANDGISLSQTAEGALTETTAMLQRMRELAVQSMNDTNSASDRANLQKEVAQLRLEIDRIAKNTQFNGKNLLDGTFNRQRFQVGANDGQELSLNIASAKSQSLGLSTGTLVTDGLISVANTAASHNGSIDEGTSSNDNFTLVGALGTETIAVDTGFSAYQIADRVNSSATDTGVTATARTYAKLTEFCTGTMMFTIQGKGGTDSQKSVSGTDVTDLIASINTFTADTGIYAYLEGTNELMLYSSEGYTIGVENFDYAGENGYTVSFTGLESDGTSVNGAAVQLKEATAASPNNDDSSFVGGAVIFETTMNNGYFTLTTGGSATEVFDIKNNNYLSFATTNTVENLDISTRDGARTAIGTVDGALDYIANIRADLGAVQNRFESTIANLQNVSENLSASRSRILDADFASETADMTKSQILIQSGVAMLAQANQLPQQVLSLLG
jgi:flagellin